MLKLLVIVGAVILSVRYAAATTCHDLQQSQLLSLNERMNQMIDTISALLPTPLKKSSSLVPPTLTPSADYTQSSPGHESTYYTSPPAYTSPTPSPYIMYVSPYAPTPTTVAITPPVQSNPISTLPRLYSPMEPEFRPEYAFPPISNLTPRVPRSQYPYEHHPQIQYQNSIPIAHSPPTSYPYIPYSFIQQPYLANYNHYSPELPPGYPGYPAYPAPLRPNIPTYPPSLSQLPLPVYMPPNSFPTYPNQPELVPSLYT